MKKTLIILTSFCITALPIAHATTVGFSPNPSARTVVNSFGGTVGISSLAWAGNFTSEAFTFDSALSISANVTAITTAGGWERFGVDTVTDAPNPTVSLPGLGISASGKLGGSIVDNNSGATQATYFNGRSLYVWLFNATTVGAATEMGIFRSTNASVPWNFATTNGGVGDVLTYSTQVSGAPTISAIGGTGSVTNTSGPGAAGTLQLIGVPEPSVLALSTLAGMGMLASRRRKQRK